MNTETKTRLEEHFKSLNNSISSWLTFAEAKNGAIVVLNTAIFSALLSQNIINKKCLLIVFVLFMISTLLSLYSFFPNLKSSFNSKRNKSLNNFKNLNLYFFKDIAKLNNQQDFISVTLHKYFPNDVTDDNLTIDASISDFANEAYINSKITNIKYIIFRISLIIDFSALILFIPMFIFYLYK